MKKILTLFLGSAVLLSACQNNTETEETTDLPSEEVDANLSVVDSIAHAHGLGVDPKDPSRLYIASHDGLLVLDDQVLYRVGTSRDDLMGFTMDAQNSEVFYSSGHPRTGGNMGFQKTSDGGLTWTKVSDGLNGPVDFHSMTVSPLDSQLIYGSYQGQIQMSEDGGSTWRILENAPEQLVSLMACRMNENMVYATTQEGIWISQDKGENWSAISQNLKGLVITLVQNPLNPNELMSFSEELGLAKSTDLGVTWTPVSGAPDTIFYYMSYSPTEEGLVYGIDPDNRIYKSTDGGENWEQIY